MVYYFTDGPQSVIASTLVDFIFKSGNSLLTNYVRVKFDGIIYPVVKTCFTETCFQETREPLLNHERNVFYSPPRNTMVPIRLAGRPGNTMVPIRLAGRPGNTMEPIRLAGPAGPPGN